MTNKDKLWGSEAMGTDPPKQLLQTVFFYVGKVFCLRGSVEQEGLRVSQLQCKYNPNHYVYIEDGSNDNSGANVRVEKKVVPVYANPGSGQRCLVFLLDKNISKLPPVAFERDLFYMTPKPVIPSDATSSSYVQFQLGRITAYYATKNVRDSCDTA